MSSRLIALPAPSPTAHRHPLDRDTAALRSWLRHLAEAAGMPGPRRALLLAAVEEAAGQALSDGTPPYEIWAWADEKAVTVDILAHDWFGPNSQIPSKVSSIEGAAETRLGLMAMLVDDAVMHGWHNSRLRIIQHLSQTQPTPSLSSGRCLERT